MSADKVREIKISLPKEIFALFLPLQTQEHLVKARREILLALRSLIDARLESLENKEGRKAEPKKKIKIE